MSGAGLVHQALVYSSRDEFVDVLAPFVREGRERGDRVFAATSGRNIAALRDALGTDADGVEFRDAREWYRHPYRTLAAYRRYVDEHANGSIVRVIGEPVWEAQTRAGIDEWARYESVLNAVFATSPAWIVCPYDRSALPEEIVAHAAETHPQLVGSDAVTGSPRFVEPHEYCSAVDVRHAAPAPAGAAEVVAEDGDYLRSRRFVAAEAAAAGLDPARVGDFVLASNELVVNARRHGREPVQVRIWRDGDEVVCEVEDGGTGIRDALAGFSPPSPEAVSGRGLWLARQLCDSVTFAQRPARFSVRLRMALSHPRS